MSYYGRENRQVDYKHRIMLLSTLFSLLFFCLVGRLWFLQIVRENHFRDLSENNCIRIQRIQSLRGYIFDRNGQILSGNRPSFDVVIIQEDLKKGDESLNLLAELIAVSVEKIRRKIKKSKSRPFEAVLIKRDLPFREVALLEEHKLELTGISLEPHPARYYPEGGEACHLIGYMGKITERQLKQSAFLSCKSWDMVGQAGVEREFNSLLVGVDGGRQVEVTADGRVVKAIAEKESVPGNNIYLTIDKDIQNLAEAQLGDEAGSIVLIDPNNGEIIALANSPGFNPNSFSIGISSDTWNGLLSDSRKPMQNRAIQSLYASGSVFKIVTASAALSIATVTPEETFFCGGKFRIGSWSYDCWKGAGHGLINLHDAIVHSCNVFFYQVGLKTGIDYLDKFAFAYGLGKRTGISLPSEKTGLVPTRRWKKKLTRESWYPGDTISLAIGQGYLTVTPVQLAVLIAAVANGGIRYRPQIVKKVLDFEGKVVRNFHAQITGRIPISKENLKIIREALKDVVNADGTGKKARIAGINVAGKTGTAQVISKKDFHEKDQSNIAKEMRDNAWFVAFAPFENPRIAAAILVENGGHGGSACAPISKVLFEAYLSKLGIPESDQTAEDNSS